MKNAAVWTDVRQPQKAHIGIDRVRPKLTLNTLFKFWDRSLLFLPFAAISISRGPFFMTGHFI